MAASLLAGCSLLRLAYDQAPQLVVWRLQRDLQLDDAQTRLTRELVQDWFSWHRTTELSGYAHWLEQARPALADNLDASQVCRWWDEGRDALSRALQAATPRLARLAVTLAPAQIDRLAQRQQAQLEALRREYLDGDVAGQRLERTLARAQRLYGRLDEAQRERVGDLLEQAAWDPPAWLARRQARQDVLISTLRALPGAAPAQAQEMLSVALLAFTQGTTAATGSATVEWRKEMQVAGASRMAVAPMAALRHGSGSAGPQDSMWTACRLAADVHSLTTTAQRRQALATFDGWSKDLRRLVGP